LAHSIEGTVAMIVIGTDAHKRSHTCGAVDALTAAVRGEQTVQQQSWSRAVSRLYTRCRT